MVPMTGLRRASNGDWYSRKGIPADIRGPYKVTHGKAREEIFRRPGNLSVNAAKQALREWDAEVSRRFEALRAQASGRGQDLTKREAAGLAARWYEWFVSRHQDGTETAEGWSLISEPLEEALSRPWRQGIEDDPSADIPEEQWASVLAIVSDRGEVAQFLACSKISLTSEARTLFLDAVKGEFFAAISLLKRRSAGDFGRDTHAPRGQSSEFFKLSGLTCWTVFEAWVQARQPAAATVNRWRGVFLALDAHFEKRDIGSIKPHEVEAWKDTLITPKRSAQVANDTWLRAARVVLQWAVEKRKALAANPFQGVSLDVPKAIKLREREFTEAEAATILKASLEPPPRRLATHNAAARRWVPWLCAYTGSRPGEMTQLRGQDVWHEGGAWWLKITPEAGTQKNRTARVVPLHPHVIEQGFADFVSASGKGALFYDPKAKRTKRDDATNPGQSLPVKARAKLAEWVRSLGVSDPNISPQHAWRHTFKRRAARAHIERRIRFAFCGHASNEEGDSYETPTKEDMAEALKMFPKYNF